MGNIRARYGAHLLEHVSSDMSKTNRKGFSVRNLYNMRQVYSRFFNSADICRIDVEPIVTLSVIKDKKEREAYLKKAVEKDWSVPQLREILVRDEVKTIPPITARSGGWLPHRRRGKSPVSPSNAVFLTRTASLSPAIPSKNNNSVRLDCGFGVIRTFKLLSPTSVNPARLSFWRNRKKAPRK